MTACRKYLGRMCALKSLGKRNNRYGVPLIRVPLILTFTQGKLSDLGNGNVARLQQGTRRPTAKGVTSAVFKDLLCLACFSLRAHYPFGSLSEIGTSIIP